MGPVPCRQTSAHRGPARAGRAGRGGTDRATIREAARIRDRAKQGCHRVLGDMDVLIADSPKLHFRRSDVVVYRCIDDDRGRSLAFG
ncbi:MAG: hypothetical protein ACRDOL_42925 [Streptosporangiaceae bacterium]